MKLNESTKLFVVRRLNLHIRDGGPSTMTMRELTHAVVGGLDLGDVEVFTDEIEASATVALRTRYEDVKDFSRDNMKIAHEMMLLGEDGEILQRVVFPSI
jgi:hypothetical protein